MKVALYVRVSTDEQKLHGDSIDAQLNELRQYAKKHNYIIYDEYIDAGYSGGLLHRPALDRLLEDASKKHFKVVLFVKLDRWFRSVPHYYKIQETLENNDINWIATQEDYETLTSSGRFKVNIMLSVSQQFKDATGERINSVFKYKVMEKREVISGAKIIGYDIVDKHYVINEEEAKLIREFFNVFLNTYSYVSLNEWCIEHNIHMTRTSMKNRLRDMKYAGLYEYNGIILRDMIPAIINEEDFNKVQQIINNNKIVRKRTDRIYLFSGLIKCPVCNGNYVANNNGKYKSYRCGKRVELNCTNGHTMIEPKIEMKVLDQLKRDIDIEIKSVKKNTKQKDNRQQIKEKQNRLKELYIEGLLSKKDFDLKYKELESKIIIPTKSNEEALNLLGKHNFMELYNLLSDKEKQIFFKNILKSITIVGDDIILERNV